MIEDVCVNDHSYPEDISNDGRYVVLWNRGPVFEFYHRESAGNWKFVFSVQNARHVVFLDESIAVTNEDDGEFTFYDYNFKFITKVNQYTRLWSKSNNFIVVQTNNNMVKFNHNTTPTVIMDDVMGVLKRVSPSLRFVATYDPNNSLIQIVDLETNSRKEQQRIFWHDERVTNSGALERDNYLIKSSTNRRFGLFREGQSILVRGPYEAYHVALVNSVFQLSRRNGPVPFGNFDGDHALSSRMLRLLGW